MTATHVLHDDAPHPSGEDRFAIYVRGPEGRQRIAETSLEGVGPTLLVLHEEGQLRDGERQLRVGIFDRQNRVWIVSPWAGERR